MRLIDADALLEKIDYQGIFAEDDELYLLVKNAPTIQREGWVSVPKELIDKFPELNEYNYTDDNVKELNAWGIELVLSAAPTETE